MYLYDVRGLTFWEHFPMCAIATFWDAAITSAIYFVLAIAFSDWFWIRTLNWREVFLVLVIGFLTALFIEERAVVDARWSYNALMPIVPFTHAGLSPVLQMLILPILTFYLSGKLLRSKI